MLTSSADGNRVAPLFEGMTIQRWFQTQTLMILLVAGAATAFPLQEAGQSSPAAPDNTKVNKRDRKQTEPTADQAKNNSSDRELMKKIRRGIVSDKTLSTYAHNVKIIADNGKVTLKGPVRTEEEKQAVESKAVEIAGAGNVTNEITVKPGKTAAKK